MTRAGASFGFLSYAWGETTMHGTLTFSLSLVQKGLDVIAGRSPPTSSSASQAKIKRGMGKPASLSALT